MARAEALVVMMIAIVVCLLTAGCTSSSSTLQTQGADHGTVVVDMAKLDPENADYWQENPINLWSQPGGWSADGQKIVGTVPSCEGIEVPIVEIAEVESRTFYKIQYQGKEGWATKYLLTGEE